MVIVGIMMMMTMGLSGEFVFDVQMKNQKDLLVDTYHTMRNHVLSSRYLVNTGYTHMVVTVTHGTGTISYDYYDDNIRIGQEAYSYADAIFTGLAVEGTPQSKIQLVFIPYQIQGQLSGVSVSDSVATFQMQAERSQKKFCFALDKKNGKLLASLCPDAQIIRIFGN